MFVFTFTNYNDNGHVGVWNSIFKVIYCCNCRYICPAGGSNMFEYIVTSSCHSRHIRPRFKRGLTHYCPFQAICGIQCNFKLLQGHVQYDMSFSQCACFRHQYTIIVKDVNFGPLLWTDASAVSKERCVHTVWARRPVLPISPHVMCWWTGWEWANRQIVNVHAADRRAHQLPRKHSPQSAQLEGERQVLFRKVTNFYWAN